MAVQLVENVSGISYFGFNRTSLAPVGNLVQAVFQATSTGLGGSKAYGGVVLYDNDPTTDGQSIQINNRTFTFRNSPGTTDLQAGITPFANGNRLYQLLRQDPVLTDDYNVYGEPNTLGTIYVIELYGKKDGTQFNVTVTLADLSLPFDVLDFSTPGSDDNDAQSKQNWRVYYRLNIATDPALALDFVNAAPAITDFVQVVEGSINYNDENKMAVDFANALAPYVKTYPPNIWNSPVGTLISAGGFTKCPEGIVFYGVEVGEEYIPTGQTVSEKFKAFTIGMRPQPDGAIARYYLATNSSLSQAHSGRRVVEMFLPFWFREPGLIDLQPIEPLTQSPTAKDTTIDSIELIYFFYYTDSKIRQGGALRYNVTYLDGTTSGDLFVTLPSLNQNTRYYVETGFRRLKTSFPLIDATKAVKSFRVAVFEYDTDPAIDGLQVTYDKTYKLRNEIAHLAFKRPILMFLNPMGGYDTLCCYGLSDREVKTDRTQFEKTPEWNQANNRLPFTIGDPPPTGFGTEAIFDYSGVSTIGQSGTDSEISYTLRTGAIDDEHARWVQDSLLTSNEIYVLDWNDFDNVGNLKVRQLRRVVFTKAAQKTQLETDIYQWEFEVKVGLNLATIKQ